MAGPLERRQARGVLIGMGGAAAATFGGYLGGHLVSARKVSTRHPAHMTEGLGT